MGNVFALVPGRYLAELDQLFSLGIECRRIYQRRSDAQRARFHFFPHEFAHLIELLRGWLFVFEADDVFTNRGCANEGGDVARDAAPFQILQILGERVPLNIVFDVALLFEHVLPHAIVHWTHRFAFAHDLGGDPLPNFTL